MSLSPKLISLTVVTNRTKVTGPLLSIAQIKQVIVPDSLPPGVKSLYSKDVLIEIDGTAVIK